MRMHTKNLGFEPQEIARIRAEIADKGRNFLLNHEEPQGDDFAHFWFVGTYEGQEVIFDAVLYSLRLEHSSKIYEIADERAAQHFPHYVPWDIQETEDGGFDLPDDLDEEVEAFKDEVMAELEAEESVKVHEHVDLDTTFDYGIGMEIGLHVDEVTDEVIADFVARYTAGSFVPDPTAYAFQHEDEDDDL